MVAGRGCPERIMATAAPIVGPLSAEGRKRRATTNSTSRPAPTVPPPAQIDQRRFKPSTAAPLSVAPYRRARLADGLPGAPLIPKPGE